MSANDFIINIVLQAKNKVAPVMAAVAAQAKAVEQSLDGVDRSGKKVNTRLGQMEGHLVKARDTLRSLNPTLDSLNKKTATFSGNVTIMNRELGKVGKQAEKAAGGLAMLDGVISKLEKKLTELDAKMEAMGARDYKPQIDVETAKSEAKVAALTQSLASATRGVHTAQTDVEIGAAMAKVQALREELERLGHGARAERVIIEVNDQQIDDAERKLRRLYNTGKQHGPFLPDQKEIDSLLGNLAAAYRKLPKLKTQVETDVAMRAIDRLEKRLIALGVGGDAQSIKLAIRAEIAEAEFQTALKRITTQAKEATKEPFSFRALLNRGEFNAQYAELRTQLLALSGVTVEPNVRLGSRMFRAERKRVEAELIALGLRKVDIKVILDYDRSKFDRFESFLSQKSKSFSNKFSGGFSGLSTRLRDAAIGLAIIFAQPLLSAITGVVTAIGSLVLAAGTGAAGLAGLANAAVFQAVPGLSLLVVGITRVAAAIKVAKLAQDERDKGAQQGLTIDNQRASAAESLANAHRGVADALRGMDDAARNSQDAQKRLEEAQLAVTAARREGIRTLEDMILAERRADLAARKSDLGLSTAIASGSGDIIQETQLDNEENQLAARRQKQDTAAAVSGGVDNLPDVVAARKGVIDARRGVESAARGMKDAARAVDDARRAVDQASRGLDTAGAKVGAAASAYDIALAKLSPGERRMLQSVESFKKLFADQDGGLRGITDNIVVGFADALDSVADLLRDNDVIEALDDLSNAVGEMVRGAAEFLTTGPMRDALIFFSDESTTNLPIVASIFRNLTLTLVNLARAASGPLTSALVSLDGWMSRLADRTEQNQDGLANYFYKALDPIKAFLRLGGAVFRLFGALAGPGGGVDAGVSGLDRMTAALDRATKYVNENGSEVRRFLFDTMDAAAEVGKVVVAVGSGLVAAFDKKTVAQFGQFLTEIVIPIFVTFVQTLGAAVHQLLLFANSDFGGWLVKNAAYALGFALAMGRVVAIGAILFRGISLLVTGLGLLARGMIAFGALAMPVKVLFVAIAGVIAILTGDIHSLGDALERLAPLLGGLAAMAVISRVLPGAAAAAAAAATARGAAAGLGGAAAASGISRFARLLRTGVITAVGFAAAKGITTGLKEDSVQAGIQDFGSTMTLGLIKSYKDSVAEVNQEAGQKLETAVKSGETDPRKLLKVTPENDTSFSGVYTGIWRSMVGKGPTQREGNPLVASLKEIEGGGEKLQKQFRDLLKTFDSLKDLDLDKVTSSSNFFDNYIAGLEDFKSKAPAAFDPAIDAMMDKIKGLQKQWHDGWNKDLKLDNLRRSITVGFGMAAQDSEKSSKEIAAGLMRGLAKLPPEMREQGKDAALKLADGLAEKGAISDEKAKNIRDAVTSRFNQMASRSKRASERTSKEVLKSLGALASVTSILMGDMIKTVNENLKAMGVDESVKVLSKTATAGITLATGINPETVITEFLGGETKADGGFVGMQGERGSDRVHAVLGRGEAVLNATHQRFVEPAMQAYYGSGLGTLFKRVKGNHAEEAPGGYAKGGYVQGASPQGLSGATQAFAERMFKLGYNVTSALRPGAISSSGNPSQHGSGTALDFGSSVNNLNKLWQVVFPLRAQFSQLLGPKGLYNGTIRFQDAALQRDHNDHIHIGFLDRVVGQIGKISNSIGGMAAKTFDRLKTPNIGRGPMAKFAEAILRKVTRAGNKKMEEAAGTDSGNGGTGSPAPPGQVREWLTKALKITGKFTIPNLNNLYGRAMQESGGNPKAINLWDSNAKAGYPSQGLLQTIPQTFAKYRLKSVPGGITNPIANAVAAIRYMYARYGHIVASNGRGYANGGPVSGPGTGTSDDIDAKLSNGEHIWTAKEVINAGGHKAVAAIRKMFGGGTQSKDNNLAEGGAPKKKEPVGVIAAGDVTDRETKQLVAQLLNQKSKIKLKERADRIQSILSEFTEKQLESIGRNLSSALREAKKGSEYAKTLKALQVNLKKFIEDPITIMSAELSRATQVSDPVQIQDLIDRVIKSTKVFQKKGEKGIDSLSKSLDFLSSDSGPFDLLETRITNRAAKAARKLASRINIISKDGMTARRGDITSDEQANAEVASLAEQRSGYQDERSSVTNLLNKAKEGLKGAKTTAQRQRFRNTITNLQNRYNSISDKITESESSILARREQQQSDNVAASNSKSDRDRGWFALLRRRNAIGAAGGSGVSDQDMYSHEMNITNTQLGNLNNQLADARATGNAALATQIEDQINELNVSVIELAVSKVQAAADAVNKYAAQRNSALDLQDRFINVAARIGGAGAAISAQAQRRGVLASRGGVMNDQRAGLVAARDQAAAQGFTELVTSLDDQIAGLDASMAENRLAILENTMATRKLATDLINTAATRTTGLIGTGGSILTKLAELNGTSDNNNQRETYRATGAALGTQFTGLISNIIESINSNEFDGQGDSILSRLTESAKAGPEAYAKALQKMAPEIAQFEATLGPEALGAFNGLVDGLSGNIAATVDNTVAIKGLDQSVAQTFSSSAWTTFRQSIFNGNGGLLPQYDIPQMHTGGYVAKSGLFELEAGEKVVTAEQQNFGGDTITNVDVNLTSPTEVADPDYLGKRIAWNINGSGRN